MDVVFEGVSEEYEEMAKEWEKLERKRKSLEFLCMHEVIIAPPREAELVDAEEEEQERQARVQLHLMLGGTLDES
jgi:hypothetical protein